MSVMIDGFEFPQSCRECRYIYPEGLHSGSCIFTDKYWELEEDVPSKSRLPECPLVEIPTPHGRLIDADELTKHMRSYYPSIDHLCRSQHVVTKGDIDNAPTIIEAEVSE